MIKNIEKVSKNLNNYLTFYHEYRIPKNYFFDVENNINSDKSFLVISSPSRMGNHLLMSALDGHHSIPKIPGEDGFLAYSFVQANYDVNQFVKLLRGKSNHDYILSLSTNLRENKWHAFKKLHENGINTTKHSGLGTTVAIQDFKDLTYDINYDDFSNILRDKLQSVKNSKRYNDYLVAYLESFKRLDYNYNNLQKNQFDIYTVFSGMRIQSHWLCQTFNNVKILSSLRSFDSYVYSHVKSIYGPDKKLSSLMIQEAWEHWFHKVIDIIWLKLHYPDKIEILLFEELVESPLKSHKSLCKSLDIKYDKCLANATIFGIPVKGNSSNTNQKSSEGTYYSNFKKLDPDKIPKDFFIIWENLKLLAIN